MTISVSLIRGLIDSAVQAGASKDELLRLSGLDAEVLADSTARISVRTQDALIEAALACTGDPAFGLYMGQTAQIGTLGVGAHMALHARSVREALDVLFRFHRVIADCEPSRLIESGDRATVVYNHVRSTPVSNRVRTEFGLTFFLRMGSMLLGTGQTAEVFFEHARPAYAERYHAIFGDAVHFGQSSTRFSFDRALLDRPYLFANTEVFEVLKAQAERQLRGQDVEASYATRVQALMVEHFAHLEPSMERVARALGVSERSLRRRLSEEGTTFRAVVHAAMAELACRILREPETSLQDASYRLGFSEPSAFHHAFKRWTGMTPSQYRAQLAP